MIKPIKPILIPFKRKSPIKTEYQKGNIPLEKDFLGGELTPETATLDHALARAKGGKSRMSNYIILSAKNNNLKGDRDIFEFATEENTEAYFNALENVQLGKHTGEQYLSMLSRTLRTLWEQSPITKDKEMWKILKRW